MPGPRRGATLNSRRLQSLASALWYAGAIIVLFVMAQSWIVSPFPQPLKPQLPYQYTPFSDPRFWVFLQQSADCVPDGARFTVTAPSREQEHELYLLAVGAVPHATPLSATYFGFRQNEHIARASHILSFGGAPPFGDVRNICSPAFGVVYERVPARAR